MVSMMMVEEVEKADVKIQQQQLLLLHLGRETVEAWISQYQSQHYADHHPLAILAFWDHARVELL